MFRCRMDTIALRAFSYCTKDIVQGARIDDDISDLDVFFVLPIFTKLGVKVYISSSVHSLSEKSHDLLIIWLDLIFHSLDLLECLPMQ